MNAWLQFYFSWWQCLLSTLKMIPTFSVCWVHSVKNVHFLRNVDPVINPLVHDDILCRTPKREPGSCISILNCNPLIDLLSTGSEDPETVKYLRASECWREKSGPIVCCPTQTSPERNLAPTDDQKVGTTPNEYHKLLPTDCGKASTSNNRIVNGAPSVLGAWPWIVALGYTTKSNPELRHWGCGGTLITAKHAVTAAHCIEHPPLVLSFLRLGELNLDPKVKDGANPIDILVSKTVVHPGYKSDTFKTHPHHDIAVVHLKSQVTFSAHIQPICLPYGEQLRSNNFEKKFPQVAGWGDTEHKGPKSNALLEVQLPVLEHKNCIATYKRLRVNLTRNQLCAGGEDKDSCTGDSGGPLMYPQNGRYYLIGVVSFGIGCAQPGFPGVYTRVTEYLEWITDSLR